MEYERIHKVQMGVMSPTKLRMKLLGSHGGSIGRVDEAKKSPRASPARLDADEDDDDHPKNSLLPQELDEDYPKDQSDSSRSRSDASHGRAGNGYDSGGFEFYREERPPPPPPAAVAVVGGTFFRQIRTRREIAALGLQLGKMNIASWASKDDDDELPRASPEKRPRPRPRPHSGDGGGEAKKREFEARAMAWQETHKCKLALRFQRKEVKIQEWESCQKAKFEAKMRHAEVQAEQMKARAKQKLSRRLSALSHKAEGKQARVEARRSRQEARLARQVHRIRETGAAPSRLRRCCSWLFL
ncbi:hypothetical protein OsJ_36858 [Oryza sativa Japonica Group]|uniref:Remorin C-terminal domain-containing protein n=1 Tax=Oryza sativa subsp. japonica TaxID=39947 RepID=B9GE96_ORYSJ|nr:hypothetical protein OsJ_36858 [Oryza sativa Japonica Group]